MEERANERADIRENGFAGFGSARGEDRNRGDFRALSGMLAGSYDVDVQWNGTRKLVVSQDGIQWKGTRVVPEEIIVGQIQPDGNVDGVRIRFTAFCAEQSTCWGPEGVVGVIESFDVTFNLDGGFSGTFKRRYEGCLDVRGLRVPSEEDQVEGMPRLIRSQSRDPEEECPVCYSSWSDEGITQVSTPCGHSFCLSCVISSCNMTPPNDSGTCPLCRAQVTLHGLVKVTRPHDVAR